MDQTVEREPPGGHPDLTPEVRRASPAIVVSRAALPYWGIFFAALAIRLAHHAFMSSLDPSYDLILPGADNHTFDRWALEISQTFWLGYDRIPFFHGPLYPYFLGLVYLRFGYSFTAAVLCQHTLGALTVVLVFHLGRRLFGTVEGWIAGLLAALSPLFLLYEGEILSDSLVLFVNVAMVCALIAAGRRKTIGRWAFAGVLIGLSTLARPNTLLFIPVAAAWCWRIQRDSRGPLRAALALVIAAGVTIAPATLANYFIGSRFALVTATGPVNLYIGNAHDAIGVFATLPSMKEIHQRARESGGDIDWSRQLRASVLNHPTSLPGILWKKTKLFWQSGEIPHNINFYLKRPFSPFLRIPLTFGVIAPLGLLGVVLALVGTQRDSAQPAGRGLVIAFLITYAASIIIVFVLDRLRMPALAALMPFAAFALTRAAHWARDAVHGPRRTAWARPAALLAAWAVLAIGLRSPDSGLLIRWNDHYNLAGAYEIRNRYEDALREYDAALGLAPHINVLAQERCRMAQQLDREPSHTARQISASVRSSGR